MKMRRAIVLALCLLLFSSLTLGARMEEEGPVEEAFEAAYEEEPASEAPAPEFAEEAVAPEPAPADEPEPQEPAPSDSGEEAPQAPEYPSGGEVTEQTALPDAGAQILQDEEAAQPLFLTEGATEGNSARMRAAAEELTLGKGEQFALKIQFADGQKRAVQYASSNAKVAKVSKGGTVTAKGGGQAEIRVSCEGEELTIPVTVCKAPKKVSLSAARKTLGAGETIALVAKLPSGSASALRFTSSNKRVAKVSSDGVVTALKAGKATITVKTFNKRKASVKITVRKAPGSVALGAHEIALGVGQVYVQSAKLSKDSAGACSFESDAPQIVSVDEATGQLTAAAVGEARVTVRTYNGLTDDCVVTVKPAPSRISLAEAQIAIGKGEKVQIPKVTLGAEGEDCAAGLRYSTSAKKYVSVTQAGEIKGVRVGSATVTVQTHNGLSAELKVTVKKAPSKVKLAVDHSLLGAGEEMPLKIKLSSGAASALRISSSDGDVVRVERRENGYVICAGRTGSATVTVKTFNKKKANLKLKVRPAPEKISLEPGEAKLGLGEHLTLEAELSEGSGGGYSFSSDDASVASVDAQTGEVEAAGIGETTIRVRSYNGLEATCAVTVRAAPSGISLSEKSVTLSVGDRYALAQPTLEGGDVASRSIRYASSNKSRMKVSAKGVITGVAAGTAKLTVRTFNGKSKTIKVYVKSAPKSVSFKPNACTMFIGDALAPELRFDNGVAGSYSLRSSNEGVVSVDADGRTLRALSAGAAKITATSFNKKTAKLTVNVPELPDSVRLEPGTAALCVGETLALNATIPEGRGARLTFESSDGGGAAVSDAGELLAIAPGSAEITVRTSNGCTAKCAVTVYEPPTGIELSPAEAELRPGETLKLAAVPQPHGVGGVIFASSDSKIASVDATGLVTAKKPGAATVTATTFDGLHSAICTLRVSGLPLEGLRIGIDPGHQGKSNTNMEDSSPKGGTKKYKVSSGTQGVSTRIAEHVTDLQIGLKLRDALAALGAEVYMTRETANVDISNQQRAFKMNELGVDLALRLHCNGSTDRSANGMDVYTRKTCAYGADVVDGKALMANEKRAAEAVFEELGAATGAKRNGIHYTDNYTMNNWSTVPCLLVEMGFMTNPEEDVKLNDPAYQEKIVQGLVNAVCVYAGREKVYP